MENKFKYDLTISLIVKNEIDNLENCLKSLIPIKKHINCEIIITDTGSTDGTIEVAKKYADKFFNFEWCNDFSKARNIGVEASEGRWFMFIDADEILDESIIKIADFLKTENSNKYDYATVFINEYVKLGVKYGNALQSIKLCNYCRGKIKFINRVHEQFDIKNNNFYSINCTIHHYGYLDEKIDQKKSRNVELLKLDYEKSPHNLRTIYDLAGSTLDETEKIELFKKGIQIAKDTNQLNEISVKSMYIGICSALCSAGKYDLSLNFAKEFLNIEKKCILPRLEVLYLAFLSCKLKKDIENQYTYFLEYQTAFKYLQKNNDNFYSLHGIYKYFSYRMYLNSCTVLTEILIDNNELEKAKNILYSNTIKEYKSSCDELSFLPQYLELSMKLCKSDLPKELCQLFNLIKTESDKLSFINDIKKAMSYIKLDSEKEKFLHILNDDINYVEIDGVKLGDYIKSEIDKTNNATREFKQLAGKIKQTIRMAIRRKQKAGALNALEQYKKVNPTDPEIKELAGQIEKL